jgi:hypothetical protein
MTTKMPPVRFEPGPCPGCGATTEVEANTMCKPSTDQTGEVSCAGEFDGSGRSIVPTTESIKAINDWIDQQMGSTP